MESKKILLILILVVIIVAFTIIFIITIYIGRNTSKKQVQTTNIKRKKTARKLYYLILSWPIIGRYISKIRSYVEMIDLSDQQTIEKRTIKMSLEALGSSAVLWMILLLLDHSIYFIIMSTVVVVMIHEQIMRFMIDRLEDKLLKQFIKFLSEVRHHYNEHHMIDEAIYDSIQTADYEMAMHGSKMYDALNLEDHEIENYYETAPNKYFKSFLALAYTVLKFGDQKVNNTSNFLKNLNFLKQEIGMALLKREKLNYLLSSLTLISVLPMFLVKPLEHWAVGSMPELLNYYQGTYGFITQIVLFILVIFSYQLVVRIRNREEISEKIEKKQKSFVLKVGFINKIVNRYISVHYSKACKMDRNLKMIGSRISVEQLYAKQIGLFVVIMMIGLIIVANFHQLAQENVLYPPFISEEKNREEEIFQRDFDASYVEKYVIEDESEIRKQIRTDLSTDDDVMIQMNIDRILGKIEQYQGLSFMWWEVLIVFGFASLGSFIPRMLIAFRKHIMLMHMEDEVLQFHTIILMLMNIKRMSVCDLLEWMSLFAVIFKEDIEQCLNDMELGDYEALEALKIRVPYSPFVRIVDNLQATANKISIEEAFDELLVERGFYQEKRKQDTEILINKKGTWGKMIAFVPMVGTILMFLLIPFTHLGLSQFSYYISEISTGL